MEVSQNKIKVEEISEENLRPVKYDHISYTVNFFLYS